MEGFGCTKEKPTFVPTTQVGQGRWGTTEELGSWSDHALARTIIEYTGAVFIEPRTDWSKSTASLKQFAFQAVRLHLS
jgi:hypothetical protein